jgi:hypothetical protein
VKQKAQRQGNYCTVCCTIPRQEGFIIGWALGAVNDRHFTLSALERAIKRRCPEAGLLLQAGKVRHFGLSEAAPR